MKRNMQHKDCCKTYGFPHILLSQPCRYESPHRDQSRHYEVAQDYDEQPHKSPVLETTQKKGKSPRLALSFSFCFTEALHEELTFRGVRQKRSVSCDPLHDVMPTRGGRPLWPFSRGSRACSLFSCCGAGMFFSSFFAIFIVYSSILWAAKVRIFFVTPKE